MESWAPALYMSAATSASGKDFFPTTIDNGTDGSRNVVYSWPNNPGHGSEGETNQFAWSSSPERLSSASIPISEFLLSHLKSDHSVPVNIRHQHQHLSGSPWTSSSNQNVSSSSPMAKMLRSATDSVAAIAAMTTTTVTTDEILSNETYYNNNSNDTVFNSSPSPTATLTEMPLLTSILTWDTMLTLILPYGIIFVLAVVGNLLVIITLTLDRSMRSVTNIFLLNLAISDLLLGVFCMPFTLVGVLLRRFIFGAFMCHLISYFQAVSVAVSVWTLVAMSIERYYAICHPFRSRESRQTRKHAYKILAVVWTMAFILMSPTAIVSRLQRISDTDHYKCREAWFTFGHKQTFTIFLDIVLLIIPLMIMVMTYSSIALTLKQNDMIHKNAANASTKQIQQFKKPSPSPPLPPPLPPLSQQSAHHHHHHHHHSQHYMTTSFCQNHTVTATTTTTAATTMANGRCCHNDVVDVNKRKNGQKNRRNKKRNYYYTSLCKRNKKLIKNSHNRDGSFSSISNNHYPAGNGSVITPSSSSTAPPTIPPVVVVHSPVTDNHYHPRFDPIEKRNGYHHHHHQSSSSIIIDSTNQQQNQNNQLHVPRTSILRVNSSYSNGPSRQRRIITMLFVVVIEFFICWTPIYVIDTMALYNPRLIYEEVSKWIGIDIISVCHLLCFCSSCTNPITYCFMNKRFRDHFMALFRCRSVKNSHHHPNNHSTTTATNISEIKGR